MRGYWIALGMLAAWPALASDLAPDGVEDALAPEPLVAPKAEPAPVERPKLRPIEDDPAAAPAPLTMTGPEQPRLRPNELDPLPPVQTPGAALPADLTADLPGSTAPQKRGPFWVELEDLRPEGTITTGELQAYQVIADLKKTVYQIAEDLDAGGKERTRLIHQSEMIGKQVNILADLWQNDANFRDACMSTKRSALVLEEELRNEPRKWSHVRWAFKAVQSEVKALRERTVEQIKGTARPITIVTKDGREIVVEAPQDPDLLRQKDLERRREDAERQKELLINQQTQRPRDPTGMEVNK
ncbi:MAG: hypothetical protein AMXMBFR7_27490 [Planctomycetota bacterium]